jgi:hypothetical protein
MFSGHRGFPDSKGSLDLLEDTLIASPVRRVWG